MKRNPDKLEAVMKSEVCGLNVNQRIALQQNSTHIIGTRSHSQTD